MLINKTKYNKGLKKQNPNNDQEDLQLLKLEGENIELFERLKSKLPKLDETELINSALKCLERKADRIIKRQLVKKVKIMSDRGLQPQQIAERLNENKIPAIGDSKKWNWSDIVWLLDRKASG
jgi:hypothetical protein